MRRTKMISKIAVSFTGIGLMLMPGVDVKAQSPGNTTWIVPETFEEDTIAVNDWNEKFSFCNDHGKTIYLEFRVIEGFINLNFISKNDVFISPELPAVERSYEGMKYEPILMNQKRYGGDLTSEGYSERIISERLFFRFFSADRLSRTLFILKKGLG